jgi:hypothetical protein
MSILTKFFGKKKPDLNSEIKRKTVSTDEVNRVKKEFENIPSYQVGRATGLINDKEADILANILAERFSKKK